MSPRHALFALCLALSAPAIAAPAAPVPDDVHSPMGAPAEGEAIPVHHVDYTGDVDGDGTPVWRDRYIGDEVNEDYQVLPLAYHFLNLLLFVGIIWFAGRRPIGDALKNRAAGIRREITEAARLRDEARQRHDDLVARLDRFEDEVVKMRAEAEQDAAQEQERLIARANAAAKQIRETAERNIRDEVVRARQALRAEAVDLAVQLAEKTLRNEAGSEDHRRLARQFLDSLRSDGVNGHG